MSDKPKIVIEVLGGNIHCITADLPVDIFLIDHDNEQDDNTPLSVYLANELVEYKPIEESNYAK